MAKIIDNEKGFKIIQTSRSEMVSIFGFAVCDYCNSITETGYLICVLNQWYCPGCYEGFVKRQTNHPEDRKIEERNFIAYTEMFNV